MLVYQGIDKGYLMQVFENPEPAGNWDLYYYVIIKCLQNFDYNVIGYEHIVTSGNFKTIKDAQEDASHYIDTI